MEVKPSFSNAPHSHPPRTGEIVKLPLAMPVAIRIKTTAVRCIVIRKRYLSLLQNRAEETSNFSLCEGGKEEHGFVYLKDLLLLKSSIETKKINIKWNFGGKKHQRDDMNMSCCFDGNDGD